MNRHESLARLNALLDRVTERAKLPRVKSLPNPVAVVSATPIAPAPIAPTPVAPTPVEAAVTAPAVTVSVSVQPEAPASTLFSSVASARPAAHEEGDEIPTLRPVASATSHAPTATDASEAPGTRPSRVVPAMIPQHKPLSLKGMGPPIEPTPAPPVAPFEPEAFTLSEPPAMPTIVAPPMSAPVETVVERPAPVAPAPEAPKPVEAKAVIEAPAPVEAHFEARLAPAPEAVRIVAPAPPAEPLTLRGMLLRSLSLRPR